MNNSDCSPLTTFCPLRYGVLIDIALRKRIYVTHREKCPWPVKLAPVAAMKIHRRCYLLANDSRVQIAPRQFSIPPRICVASPPLLSLLKFQQISSKLSSQIANLSTDLSAQAILDKFSNPNSRSQIILSYRLECTHSINYFHLIPELCNLTTCED